MRKSKEELQELEQQLGTKELWSYSRLQTYQDDPYIYMLKYLKHINGDRLDSIYGSCGGYVHDLIDEYIEGKITQSQMLENFNLKMIEFELGGLKFNRSDEEKDKSIAKKYNADIRHFLIHYQKPQEQGVCEPFSICQCGCDSEGKPIYIIGYIDYLNANVDKDGEKNINIIDFKTSTKYSPQSLKSHSKQLLIYALGAHQKTNVPFKNIHIKFQFLKYITVQVAQVKGGFKPRDVERYNAVEKLASPIRTWLKKSKENLDELTIEALITQSALDNNLDCLPADVQDKFKFGDCFVEVPYTVQDIEELRQEVENTVNEIHTKTQEYYKCKTDKEKDKVFWKDVTDDYSYFCANLSEYSPNIHKPYAKYLEEKSMFEDSYAQQQRANDVLNKPTEEKVTEITDDALTQLLNDLCLGD